MIAEGEKMIPFCFNAHQQVLIWRLTILATSVPYKRVQEKDAPYMMSLFIPTQIHNYLCFIEQGWGPF